MHWVAESARRLFSYRFLAREPAPMLPLSWHEAKSPMASSGLAQKPKLVTKFGIMAPMVNIMSLSCKRERGPWKYHPPRHREVSQNSVAALFRAATVNAGE